MNDADRDKVAENLKALALRFLGENAADEKQWPEAFQKAVRFHRLAQQIATGALDRRAGPEYVLIQQLIEAGELGASKEPDSVLEKRIRPRIPTRVELAKVREHFAPGSEDSSEAILEQAITATDKASIPETRLPGTILALMNGLDSFDDIKASGTVHWRGASALFLRERTIIEPTNPPSMDDIMPLIDAAMDEFQHHLCENWR